MILWLVVDLPLWKIWKSIGMVIPNIWKHKTCSKPPTSTRCSKTSVLSPRVSKNSLSQGCSKPPTSFQIPHETYGLWHQLPGSDLGRLRHWPRAKNLNDVTKVGGFPGWSWVAWWLKKIKQLRRFSQLYLFYLSCFFFGSWRKVYHDFWENREETVDNPNARIRIFRQVNGNMFGEGAWSQYKDLGKSWKIDFARFKTCDSVIFSCSVMSKPLLPTIDIDLTWAFHWCIMKSLMIHVHGGCNGWTTCREKNITNHCYHKEKNYSSSSSNKDFSNWGSASHHGWFNTKSWSSVTWMITGSTPMTMMT